MIRPPPAILVVDDLAANRLYLVTLLQAQGYVVREATDGAAGLVSISTNPPDLVITDVLMPVMDGYEFVRRLRLDPRTRDIPLVFYTAHYSDREARELALKSGVSWVLTKPAGGAMVLETVVRALSGQKEMQVPPLDAARAAALEREHLRMVTDKLAHQAAILRASSARWKSLIAIGEQLASEPNPERMLERVCVAVRDMFGATYVTLGMLDAADCAVQRVITCGADATATIAAAPWVTSGATVEGILCDVVAKRRALRGDNPGGDPAGIRLPAGHPPVFEFLVAPVRSPDHALGWICVVHNQGHAFTDDDEQLLMALSGAAGRIYEMACERKALVSPMA